jgi:hypothetical protein
LRIPLDNFGKFGVVADTLNAALPIGTWTDAKNMRFSGLQMEKMLEPLVEKSLSGEGALGPVQWMQGWADGLSTYVIIAAENRLYFLRRKNAADTGIWVEVSKGGSAYSSEGRWSSFSWGDTVIFNNQVDPPQIFNPGKLRFADLPNWGLVSTATDIANFAPPSRYTNARCKILVPYKNFLIAAGVTEGGRYQPNTVWWSDTTNLSTYQTSGPAGNGPPLWDYESPATLSGKSEVGIGSGSITCAAPLNENLVIYTDGSTTNMQFVGGGSVMSFRRLFQKGAAGLNCAAEVGNQHFVVSRDQLYVHDGSSVSLIAVDRVEEEFFRRVAKGGRHGSSVDGAEPEWNDVLVAKNPDRKELTVLYKNREQKCVDYMKSYVESNTNLHAYYVLADNKSSGTGYLDDESGNGRTALLVGRAGTIDSELLLPPVFNHTEGDPGGCPCSLTNLTEPNAPVRFIPAFEEEFTGSTVTVGGIVKINSVEEVVLEGSMVVRVSMGRDDEYDFGWGIWMGTDGTSGLNKLFWRDSIDEEDFPLPEEFPDDFTEITGVTDYVFGEWMYIELEVNYVTGAAKANINGVTITHTFSNRLDEYNGDGMGGGMMINSYYSYDEDPTYYADFELRQMWLFDGPIQTDGYEYYQSAAQSSEEVDCDETAGPEGLVWNFEDNNFTFMDASIDVEEVE